jgi:hypothetical protein
MKNYISAQIAETQRVLLANELEELHFELTYRCSQKCLMCNIMGSIQFESFAKKKKRSLLTK